MGPGNCLLQAFEQILLPYEKESPESHGLHWAIPRFPTDDIGVPGLAQELVEKERKGRGKKRKAKHVPYLRVTPL